MRRLGGALIFVAACTHSGAVVLAGDAGAAPAPVEAGLLATVDAGVDLVALQIDLGRRVAAADDVLTALGDGANKRAAITTGNAAKLQIALLETPAAAPTDAEARVADFERAVAAAK